MNTPSTLIAICTCVLLLGACDKTQTSPPTPTVAQPVPTPSGSTSGSATDPSLPSAASVFEPTGVDKVDPKVGRSNNSMSNAQESTAMPMPGQTNDHSAPLGPGKRASSP